MNAREALLAVGLAGVVALPGCGRAPAGREPAGRTWGASTPAPGRPAVAGRAAPAEDGPAAGASLDSSGGLRRLAPLRDADVILYGEIMAAAASRLDHPTAEDRRVLARADAAQRAVAGTDPEAMASEAEAITRAIELRTRMDDAIVRERHIDRRWYELVRDRIESLIPPQDVLAGGDAGSAGPMEPMNPSQAEYRRLAHDREQADAAVLAPRRAELQRLIRRVRFTSMIPGN